MEESVKEKPTRLLYLVPVFMGLLGGILMYIAVKDQDQEMANDGMFIGTVISIAEVAIFIVIWFGSIIRLSDLSRMLN